MAAPNRRDRLHAYQFMLQRMVSAFVTRDTDPVKSPFRRGGISTFMGSMLMIVIMAGFGLLGVFRPGGSASWQKDDALVVEKGTGAIYVFRAGTLYPMANFASARLLVPPDTEASSVSPTSLAGVPRGDVLGIPGAPHTLVAPDGIVAGPWTMCAVPEVAADTDGAVTDVRSVLLVGEQVDGGSPAADSGVLVHGETSEELFLVWRGTRFAMSGEVAAALVLVDQPKVSVPDAWLESIPRGGDIEAAAPAGTGQPSTLVEGATVGQVLQVRTTGSVEQLVLVESDQLVTVTPLEAAVLLGLPQTQPAYGSAAPELVPVSPSVLSSPRGERQRPPDELAPPPVLPQLLAQREDESLCATWSDADRVPVVTVSVRSVPQGRPVAVRAEDAVAAVDEVVVPPGRAALVEAPTSGQVSTGALSLVADDGVRYGMPTVEAVAALGYGSSELVVMPSSLVDRLPTGPDLDPARAAEPVSP